MTFIVGQRWVSHAEAKLGLGIITECEGRRVSVSFPAVGEQRTYATDSAPLSRIRYKAGEVIRNLDDQKFTVLEVHDQHGLLIYHCVDCNGDEQTLDELELDCFIQYTTPQQRMFSGQFDKHSLYRLRIETLDRVHYQQQSELSGLQGSRTSLLHHQLYIASQVARRYAPRVLLADEVGLGKTIEAGMILHYQIHTGRAERVLIVVPDSLVHQWFVEMLRRFNLHFAIFDESRLAALNEQNEDPDGSIEEMAVDGMAGDMPPNPFETEQLVLCSLSFISAHGDVLQQILQAHWDLLVVDEAHHLHWTEASASKEYQCIEQLSKHCEGLLLLTATPEQVGVEGHFARLRLLDPARFHSLQAFKQEQSNYAALNKVVQELIRHYDENGDNAPLSEKLQDSLGNYLSDDDVALAKSAEDLRVNQEDPAETTPVFTEKERIIQKLLDQHGTGRVLFRNTRTAVQGFPQRRLFSYPLPCPEVYLKQFDGYCLGPNGLYPELGFNEQELWIGEDPRVEWLVKTLKKLRPEKVLVICAHAETAVALEHYLHLRAGIRSAAFYEGLSILERDRAAAYFADDDNGAQTLVCSEIGSEGRNFQFAHHLVLFDLPLNPDLLEQRIGRLDRIGQSKDIHIHVPYLQGTSQEVLFRWYHEGMQLFEQCCSAAYAIYEYFESRLHQQLSVCDSGLDELIGETRAYTRETNEKLQAGRDQLLELSSCNRSQADEWVRAIESLEQSSDLQSYMERLFDEFGIEHEEHSEQTKILSASEHMRVGEFPGLKPDGNTVTFSRKKALAREDIDFLSWEHPMVSEAMDMVLHSEIGNATLATLQLQALKPGTLLLESHFTVDCIAPKYLQLDRFLPLSPVRVLMDYQGNNLTAAVPHDFLNQRCEKIQRNTAQAIIKQVRDDIDRLADKSTVIANTQLKDILSRAKTLMQTELTTEIERLQDLQKLNSSIRDKEIAYYSDKMIACEGYLQRAALKLQAIRVIVAT